MPGRLKLGARREEALQHAAGLVARAWHEFDHAREVEALPSPELIATLREPLPDDPGDVIEDLDLAAEVLDTSLAQARPRYLAYIGSSGLEVGALADLLAHSYDINLALDARAASYLDRQAIAWLAEFLGFPAGAGSFTSGGTISNITALAAARERALPGCRTTGMGGRRPRLYCSDEAHYSVTRAAELLGIGRENVRDIAIDELRRMDPVDLARQIDEDIAEGVTPIAVVATGGTTLTGAVDPIDAIADVCRDRGVWLHVDGAYGLPAAASASSGFRFAGLDRVDSLSVDAHKWLFVPKACSAVLVRRMSDLAATFSHDEAYIPHEDEQLNAVDITLEYSRPLRALKLWLAFRVHGAQAFRDAIDRNIGQARLMYDLASADPEFRTRAHPPQLSITPIQHVLPGCPDVDEHNAALCRAIQEDGRVYLSPAVIDGEIWLRPCFTNFRTTDDDVRETLAVAAELGRDLCPAH
ncbi:MAG: aminotransferase class V-fold PLP-dependent enzyme [Actinomycetales bacterium]|nr:aminotransferase class V-fold PLP-dependent enzyme [Actinomycetales bacterium]